MFHEHKLGNYQILNNPEIDMKTDRTNSTTKGREDIEYGKECREVIWGRNRCEVLQRGEKCGCREG